MNDNYLGGQAEISLNGVTIPSYMIQDITFDVSEGTREVSSLAGNFTKPSGTLDTVQMTFNLLVTSIDYLKALYPDLYNAPTAPQTTGNLVFGADGCTARASGPVNVHYTCEETDDNDINFPNAQIGFAWNATYNQSDALSIEVTVYGQPSNTGIIRLGTGDLTGPSRWDAATGQTVPIGS